MSGAINEIQRMSRLVSTLFEGTAVLAGSAKTLEIGVTLINRQTALTADTALRLARAFGTTPAFWMGLQAQYDIECAEHELGGGLKKITPIARNAV